MNVYITYGTIDYLSKLKEQHPTEKMVLLQNVNTATLIHETIGPPIFKEPKKYVAIDHAGDMVNSARFAVFHHIPVTDEGRPLFERLFKEQTLVIEKEKGFIALRVLKPDQKNTYIVLTFWEEEGNFNNWKASDSYRKAFEPKKDTRQKKIILKPLYITTYYVVTEDE